MEERAKISFTPRRKPEIRWTEGQVVRKTDMAKQKNGIFAILRHKRAKKRSFLNRIRIWDVEALSAAHNLVHMATGFSHG
jgi:hypothetical protein